MVHRTGCHFFCWVMWQPVLWNIWSSYVGWAWLVRAKFEWPAIKTSCIYTQPTQHHKKQKRQQHDLPQPPASSGFNFIGECHCHMMRNQSHSTQHGNIILINETNIFFILLTIILQVLDLRTDKLKVNYLSDYLLFFLVIASKQRALTVSIHRYFNCRCPPSPCHVLAWFRMRGARRHCRRAITHTQVPR